MAGRISPVEAIKYTAVDKTFIHKKQTTLVVLSLSLSLILLESVMILANSIDTDKYCSKMSSNDFLVAHADYFNNDFGFTTNDLSMETVKILESLPGFVKGGGIYGGSNREFSVVDPQDKHDADYI